MTPATTAATKPSHSPRIPVVDVAEHRIAEPHGHREGNGDQPEQVLRDREPDDEGEHAAGLGSPAPV